MKRILLFFVLLFVITNQCVADYPDPNSRLSAWLLGDDQTFIARLGYKPSPRIEVGIESAWLSVDIAEGRCDVPGVVGAYGIYKFPDIVQIPNPIPFEWLPAQFAGTAYFGIHAGLDLTNEGTFVGPIAGVIFNDVMVIEYTYVMSDYALEAVDGDHRIMLGLKFDF